MNPSEKTAEELAAMKDSEIDFSDNPATDRAFWKGAKVREFGRTTDEKTAMPVIVDAETIEYFKQRGGDLPASMGAALKEYTKNHPRPETP